MRNEPNVKIANLRPRSISAPSAVCNLPSPQRSPLAIRNEPNVKMENLVPHLRVFASPHLRVLPRPSRPRRAASLYLPPSAVYKTA